MLFLNKAWIQDEKIRENGTVQMDHDGNGAVRDHPVSFQSFVFFPAKCTHAELAFQQISPAE